MPGQLTVGAREASGGLRIKPFSDLATVLASQKGALPLFEPPLKNESSACAQVVFHQTESSTSRPLQAVAEAIEKAHAGKGKKIVAPLALGDLVPRPSGVRRVTPPEKQANPNRHWQDSIATLCSSRRPVGRRPASRQGQCRERLWSRLATPSPRCRRSKGIIDSAPVDRTTTPIRRLSAPFPTVELRSSS
mmetsp:Transcript_86157/g.136005  ORF Transcript_86157/g.136005 Transcript_86157/m.136005 type:complete len:191 (-) Transcript_86157:25-597(-)